MFAGEEVLSCSFSGVLRGGGEAHVPKSAGRVGLNDEEEG